MATSFRQPLRASCESRVRLHRQRRETVPSACLECRKRKIKRLIPFSLQCSGVRPTCSRCSNLNIGCGWDTEPETTPRQAIKDSLERLIEVNSELLELVENLCSRPETEAIEILHRLRASGNRLHVLNLVRTGDILLGIRINEAREGRKQMNLESKAGIHPKKALDGGS
ncbi:hypothetical protein CABS01_16434 [Colletotrichum abscissum]|uniref:Zn(2)-C6 fungal-type domain-containing protein n=1 Tax=Colletotrichum cuscutae TaxID=1209917 RepID=A0AAI9VAY5_9PEZI|nr:uncharacterized protein CABS01_16434 [Colletotrichum abscissum]KAI3552335.1 hypothetical protein CSPX01_00084 [Colletotrichum filicis]KAK1471219.1 hypothetical protein CABS01_16434 [Colletotrichum abscissum]KAK1471430.1 hypothetical protein CCUS01_05911 [Colletotrichum cuscutae]